MNSPNPEQTALDILVSHNLSSPPTFVEDLATKLNIEIIKTSFDSSNVSGVLVYKNGRFIIGINSTHTPERQRFTIAHELGHYVLHKKRFHMDTEFVEGEIMYRDDKSATGEIREEVEANLFAASILMPKNIFISSWKDLHSISDLATKFKVSVQAATFRLKSLGLGDV